MGRVMMICCREEGRSITAPCGRLAVVCPVCDNGINECTEGYCTHPHIALDREETEPCEKGTVGCCLIHSPDKDDEGCESW